MLGSDGHGGRAASAPRASLALPVKSLSTLLSTAVESRRHKPQALTLGLPGEKKPASPNSTPQRKPLHLLQAAQKGAASHSPVEKSGLPGSANYLQVGIYKKTRGSRVTQTTAQGEAKPGKAAPTRRTEGSKDCPGPRSLALNTALQPVWSRLDKAYGGPRPGPAILDSSQNQSQHSLARGTLKTGFYRGSGLVLRH